MHSGGLIQPGRPRLKWNHSDDGWTARLVDATPPTGSSSGSGPIVTTPLTPNSVATANASGDPDQNTLVQFKIEQVPYWTVLVSAATTEVSLTKDTGDGVVTFLKGLTVDFSAQGGGSYIVTVTGKIEDSDMIYKLTGKLLGYFMPTASTCFPATNAA